MKSIFLISLLLIPLSASASEKYRYLHCSGFVKGEEGYKGKVKPISRPIETYITLDEENSRMRFGQKTFSSGRWRHAVFNSSIIFQKDTNEFGKYSCEIDRNTGEYIYLSNKQYSWGFMRSTGKGICKKQTPRKF